MSSSGGAMGLKAIRPRRACLACRQLKAKCIPTEASISSKAPCKRCTQMDLQCEYLARKRRRASPESGRNGNGSDTRHHTRRKSSRDDSEHRDRQIATSTPRHHISPQDPYFHHSSSTPNPSQSYHRVPELILASSQSSIYPFTATSSTSKTPFGLPDVTAASLNPNTPRPIPRARYQPAAGIISELTVKAPSKPVPVLDMIKKLDPGSTVTETDISPSSTHPQSHSSREAPREEQAHPRLGPDPGSFHAYSADDPILALGMYVQDAWELFDQYLLEMIQVSAELDPVYNTFQSVRLRSPTLLSSILYASARFHRPLLAPMLQAHARMLAYRAVSTNECAIETVQALFILTFWKNPADQTAWMDSGCAIRMGQALGLHRSIEKSIGEGIWDEKEKREVVAAQRTWYALCCLDHTWSNHATGLPPAIPLNYCYGAREWALTTAEPDNLGDYQLACSLEFSCQLHSHVSLADEWEGAHMTEIVLEGLRRSELAIDRHRAYWYTPPMLDRLTRGTQALTQSFVGLQYCEIKYDQHRLRPDVYPRDDVLSAVDIAISLAVRLAGSGVMHFLSDGCNLRISRIGTMLFELFEHADDETRRRLQEHVQDILDALEPLINQPIETSCMYIARYYRRLQEVFNHTMRMKAAESVLSADQVKTEAPPQLSSNEPDIDPLAFEQFWQHLPVDDPALASWLELANGFPLADLPFPQPN